jgi:hypothetical protein
MTKKIKQIKGVAGTDISNIQGYHTWLTCTTDSGEKFSINFKLLFSLFDDYEFTLEKYGERFRAIGFYNRSEGKLINEILSKN